MKKLKIGRIFVILILLSLFILISAISYVDAVSNNIADSVFRLHVIANSDSKEDQELKLKVNGLEKQLFQSQKQVLQLKNDNLGVQVQVLQSEQSAQMFLYGAATIVVGVVLGFLIASYVYTKRRRQW